MTVTFENTANKTEVTKWYSVEGADPLPNGLYRNMKLIPISARFTFREGNLENLLVTGRLVKVDGTPANRVITVPGIFHWNQPEWPEWLNDLYALVLSDLAEDKRLQGSATIAES